MEARTKRERERYARRKEYGMGGRKKAAKGRDNINETQEKLAEGRFGARNQATELDGRVRRADPDGRIGQAPQVTMLFTPWVAPDTAIQVINRFRTWLRHKLCHGNLTQKRSKIARKSKARPRSSNTL